MRLTDETIEQLAGLVTCIVKVNHDLREKTDKDFGIEIDDVIVKLSLYDRKNLRFIYHKTYYRSMHESKLKELLDEFTELIEKTEAELNGSELCSN